MVLVCKTLDSISVECEQKVDLVCFNVQGFESGKLLNS